MRLAQFQNTEAVRLLLNANADAAIKDNYGKYAFSYTGYHNVVYGLLQGAMFRTPAKITPRRREKATEELVNTAKATNIYDLVRLIEEGADVNGRNKNGSTVLMQVASGIPGVRDREIAILIGAGAEVNAKNEEEWTALMLAARYNSSQADHQALLEAGADVDAQLPSGMTSLMLAAKFNNPFIARTLLSGGANARIKDKTGKDAYDHAQTNTKFKHEDLRMLEMAISDKDKPTYELFMRAKDINPEDLQLYMKLGLDTESTWDWDKRTLLMQIVHQNPDVDVLKILLSTGMDIEAKSSSGLSSLMFAAQKNPNAEVLKTLLKAGANVNAKTEKFASNEGSFFWARGTTPLMFAAQYNSNTEVVKTLLDAGADVNAQDEDGFTALMLAALFNPNIDILKILIDSGAEINLRSRENSGMTYAGSTALMWAASRHPNADALKILIKAGADLNIQNKDGCTALMLATKNPCANVLKVLLEAGADTSLCDNIGFRTIDYINHNVP
jgi:ankyrin repeat protein